MYKRLRWNWDLNVLAFELAPFRALFKFLINNMLLDLFGLIVSFASIE